MPRREAQLQPVGQALYALLQVLAADYGQTPAYQVAARLFSEQYLVAAETAQAKANQEISASSLQSLDDLEATYREKNRVGYKGYVANVTETCDPENPLQLITDVRVAPNTTEDETLLTAALPELKQRTDLDTLYTDGAYGGPQSDTVLREQQVTLIQTAIKGRKPDPATLHLADFVITQDAAGVPLEITCPEGQTVPVTPGRKPQRFAAQFATAHLRSLSLVCRRSLSAATGQPAAQLAPHLRPSRGRESPTTPTQSYSGPVGQQLTARRRGHRPLGQASLPSRQVTRARPVPHHLPDRRVGRHDQRAAHPTLPAENPPRRARTAGKLPRSAKRPWGRPGSALFWRLCRSSAPGIPAMGGVHAEVRLLNSPFFQGSHIWNSWPVLSLLFMRLHVLCQHLMRDRFHAPPP